MGWTGVQKKIGMSKLEIAIEGGSLERSRIVAFSQKGSVLYVAYRAADKVFAVVILFEREKEHTYTKDMDEDAGPFYYGASAKVLDALTPTTSTTAMAWRDRCRLELAKAATVTKFKVGDAVTPARDISFGSHGTVAAGTIGSIISLGRIRHVVHFDGHGLRRTTVSLLTPSTKKASSWDSAPLSS